MAMTICAYENPRLFGGNFDVMYNFPGKILDITNGGIHNCGFGQGVNSTYFFAHCESSGSDKMSGLWAVKYEYNSLED